MKQMQFPSHRTFTMDFCGRPLTVETGKVAQLCLLYTSEAETVERDPG